MVSELLLLLTLHFTSPVFAADNTFLATISATVPDQTVPDTTLIAAELIDPHADSVTKNPRPEFSWHPGTSAVGINYEQFYLDDQLLATNIYPGTTTQDLYFYSLRHTGDTFYLTPKYDLDDGWHHFRVVTYNTSNRSITSENRAFYVDHTAPLIILNQVGDNQMYWSTNDTQSIPAESNRYLTVTTKDPILKGKVEAYSNLTLSLCNQTITINDPDGNWEHRFYDLLPNTTYAVTITAVDAAGNVTNFPIFYITYIPTSIISIIYPTPTPTYYPIITPEVTPIPTPILTPPATPSGIVTPTPSLLTPTPPPIVEIIEAPSPTYSVLNYISVFGLVLHLTFAILGLGIPLSLIPQFLLKLAYPFFFHHLYQTRPFTIINFYQPDKLSEVWKSTVSNIQGYFSLPDDQPLSLFIKMFKVGYHTPSAILPSKMFPYLCFSPLLTTPLNALQRLQKFLMSIRLLPLLVAISTSTAALFLSFRYYYLIYLYLSLQYLYSEYLYPKAK